MERGVVDDAGDEAVGNAQNAEVAEDRWLRVPTCGRQALRARGWGVRWLPLLSTSFGRLVETSGEGARGDGWRWYGNGGGNALLVSAGSGGGEAGKELQVSRPFICLSLCPVVFLCLSDLMCLSVPLF